MMAFFLLLTLYAAIRSEGSPGRRWHALAIVACLAGTVCKETIAVAPLLVALYDRVYLYPSWREAARARGSLYLGLAASWLVLGGIVLSGPRAAVSGFSSGVSPWTYLLNQAVIVVDYLRLSIWPSGLVVLYGWPETLTLGDVLPYALGVVALLAITLVALVRAPRLGYLGAWFFIALAPDVEPRSDCHGGRCRATDVSPADGAGGAGRARRGRRAPRRARRHRERRRAARVAAAVMLGLSVAGLAALTVRRTAEYASPLTLARTVVERRPTAVAHHLLGEHLALAGQSAEAEKELRAAIALGNSRARYQLGALLLNAQRFRRGGAELEAFVATAGVPQRLRWLEPPLLEVLTSRLRAGADLRRRAALGRYGGTGAAGARGRAAASRGVTACSASPCRARRCSPRRSRVLQGVPRGAARRRHGALQPGDGAHRHGTAGRRRSASCSARSRPTRATPTPAGCWTWRWPISRRGTRVDAARTVCSCCHEEPPFNPLRAGVRSRWRPRARRRSSWRRSGVHPVTGRQFARDDERRRRAVARAARARARGGSGSRPAPAEGGEGLDGGRRRRRLRIHEPASGPARRGRRGASTRWTCSLGCCSCCSRTPPRPR